MTTAGTTERVQWGHSAFTAEFATAADGSLRTVRLGPPDAAARPLAQATPVVEVLALGHGSAWSGRRSIETVIGGRLRLRDHARERDGVWHRLRLRLFDADSGLTAELHLASPEGLPVVRAWVEIGNEGPGPLTLLAVSSLALGGLPAPGELDLHWADNDWLAECRWHRRPLREALPDLNRGAHERDSRGRFGLGSRGSWSTDGHLAMGALTERGGRGCWLWQVESACGWAWETGEREGGTYLALHGPTDTEHQWRQRLLPGESFRTEAAALAVTGDGFEGALAALTGYRRQVRRPHPDHESLPVIFNDYMNTIGGDPTTAKLLPLIDAAARAGAEYFVIDSGWYDDDAVGWWDSVGAWEPAASRFPGPRGIHEVLDRIRDRGMVPGLWLEPEVVGVRSALGDRLPPEAFFRRDGVRVSEHGRYQLDLRHPAAARHLDETVDRIVGDWGVGYLKLDYNISVPPGTDGGGADSPGAGLLGHTRAYRRWLDSVLDRYPRLVIENCASGGMRMDGAMLRVAQLQSTSDQQDHLRYPPISAAAPTAVPPEQGAVWAYAQPEFTDDENGFILAGALLGRVHLSGHLDRMSEAQLGVVTDAVRVYKKIRADLPRAVPFWPLGLPDWTAPWIALGMRAGSTSYLTVWRRDGDAPQAVLPLPQLLSRKVDLEILYPTAAPGSAAWSAATGELTVTLDRLYTALVLRFTA
ncbi:alpha-galactosidase [Streptomyces sp. DSM 44938]|uniref:Alpha-galactosidase n=1 Tax=Streptomyces litchfieldiae TaxID=3075543 RepID=A0ABU2MS25_9ACTN|nr:alpha-galactosidase [Streptomyces sp. DSM 44938]MDT0344411.1 alpha-galactosidase [Streptomyces sp. DSM 44938]